MVKSVVSPWVRCSKEFRSDSLVCEISSRFDSYKTVLSALGRSHNNESLPNHKSHRCYGGRNRKVSEAFVRTGKPLDELEAEMLGGQKLQGPMTAKEV